MSADPADESFIFKIVHNSLSENSFWIVCPHAGCVVMAETELTFRKVLIFNVQCRNSLEVVTITKLFNNLMCVGELENIS